MPALGALAAAAINTGDAQRREQGRRSGTERWQQALKILLVDAAALFPSLAPGVELAEHEAAAHTDEGESVRSSSLETKTGSGQSSDTAAVTSYAHDVL